ncbi:TonB family protein [Adhaeribacter aquaticus]|uniref:TonB family protein n=1 Tax=Adhaeribacter aquaticus TaxID=299567 RepID=UPI0004275F14|nr:TonB family protein [Adhaeribacter aquaticus]
MTTPNITPITPTENHLSTDQIYRYLEGQLPPEQMHQLEKHVIDCNLCREAMDGLSLIPKQIAQPFIFDINRHLHKNTTRRIKHRTIGDIKNWALTTAILFLLIFAGTVVWYAAKNTAYQNSKTTNNNYTAPVPVVGMEAYKTYLKDSLRYPTIANQPKSQGIVELQFTINPDGSYSQIKVLKSLGNAFDAEAIRLLKQGPNWKPAYQNKQAVSQTTILKVLFQ